LLDNLFLNPMAPHNKASDYTNGCKNRGKGIANDIRSNYAQTGSSGSFGAPPQGFPPGAFHTSYPDSGQMSGLGPYGMAAQVGIPTTATAAIIGAALNPEFQIQQPANGGDSGATMEGGFDIFNFLMDEEGLGGTATWDALEVPTDISLWS
jgi:hypothetical protein